MAVANVGWRMPETKLLFVSSFVPLSAAFWLAMLHERVEALMDELVTGAS